MFLEGFRGGGRVSHGFLGFLRPKKVVMPWKR